MVRHKLAWSNSWQSWQERLGTLFLFAAGAALAGFGNKLEASQQLVLWGLLLLALAVLLRRGWIKLFGPVFFYEMVRTGRRDRNIILRWVYAVIILIVLIWVNAVWSPMSRARFDSPAHALARLAESFFASFINLQFLAAAVFTPAFVAGAIAEEKDRRTLEFLLATDLRSREIILGKLAARLASLLLIFLTGLPILSFLQFLGGVDPELLLASFAALGLTLLSLASLSIFCSTMAHKPRDAIVLTYLLLVGYLVLSSVVWDPLQSMRSSPLYRVGEAFTAGNIGIVLFLQGANLLTAGAGFLTSYAAFHGVVTLLCLTLAITRLRARAMKDDVIAPSPLPGRAPRSTGFAMGLVLDVDRPERSPLGDQPMLWKEIHVERGLSWHWLARVVMGMLVVLSFVPLVYSHNYDPLKVNYWVRIVGTQVACLMLLAVALRAAGSISGERDRQTLDSLLTTPLDSRDIVRAKWVGSILSVRWSWLLWLGAIWLIGVFTGGMSLLAVPLLLAAWLVYASVFAWIGLWFSMTCRTTLRATMWTLVTAVFAGGGHWLLSIMCCFLPARGNVGNVIDLAIIQFGQTPPLVLVLLAFRGADFQPSPDGGKFIVFSVLGIFAWTFAAITLASICQERFRQFADGARRASASRRSAAP